MKIAVIKIAITAEISKDEYKEPFSVITQNLYNKLKNDMANKNSNKYEPTNDATTCKMSFNIFFKPTPHPKYFCISDFLRISSCSRLCLMVNFDLSVCSTK